MTEFDHTSAFPLNMVPWLAKLLCCNVMTANVRVRYGSYRSDKLLKHPPPQKKKKNVPSDALRTCFILSKSQRAWNFMTHRARGLFTGIYISVDSNSGVIGP
jgi:hypothetical protein